MAANEGNDMHYFAGDDVDWNALMNMDWEDEMIGVDGLPTPSATNDGLNVSNRAEQRDEQDESAAWNSTLLTPSHQYGTSATEASLMVPEWQHAGQNSTANWSLPTTGSSSTYGTSSRVTEPPFPLLMRSVSSNRDVVQQVAIDSRNELDNRADSGRLCDQSDTLTKVVDDKDQNKPGLRCTYPGCTYDKTFARTDTLARHLSKHNNEGRFICPAVGCFQGPKRKAFHRKYRLINHIRAEHSCVTSFECHHPSCSHNEMELDLLVVHYNRAHPWYDTQLRCFEEHRKCPVWGCKEWTHYSMLRGHILTHSKGELEGRFDCLQDAGFSLAKSSCPHLGQQQLKCNCPITGINIRCPICDTECQNETAFSVHIEDNHLLDKQQITNFQEWKKYAQTSGLTSYGRTVPPELSLGEDWYLPFPNHQIFHIQCPACTWSQDLRPFCALDHHFSMIGSMEEVKPHRRAILKHWPGFGKLDGWKHIWDDISTPVQREKNGTGGTQA